MSGELKDKTAIVGIGWTEYTKNSGVSVLTLALRAAKRAIADSGLETKDIDGVVTFALGDSVGAAMVATHLGLPVLHHLTDISSGGSAGCLVIARAAMAVATGQANNVLVFRAMNGASGVSYSAGDRTAIRAATGAGSDAEPQFLAPYGALLAQQYFSWLTRRHMIKYGTTTKQLGAVAISTRKHACLNERAMMRSPMTWEDYEKSPWICEPLRLFDCCLTSDGACALVVTSAERARNLKHPPVYITAAAEGSGPYSRGGMWANYLPDHAECYAKYVAPLLWQRAGMEPKDIDIAEIYDCFTYSVICQLEDFGFCKKGEGGPFVEGGRIGLGGELPVNTHGGLLSEAYIHGLNSAVEAVSQLRGEAGARQVKAAETALVTAGGAGALGSALILRK